MAVDLWHQFLVFVLLVNEAFESRKIADTETYKQAKKRKKKTVLKRSSSVVVVRQLGNLELSSRANTQNMKSEIK
jgi:hypothetical protein